MMLRVALQKPTMIEAWIIDSATFMGKDVGVNFSLGSYDLSLKRDRTNEKSESTTSCTECVRWIVLKTPVKASAGQTATFKTRIGPATNRPVQPVNARMILD